MTYRNVDEMTPEQMKTIVEKIIELDKLEETSEPEVQLALVTEIKALIQLDNELIVSTDTTDAPVEDGAGDEIGSENAEVPQEEAA